VFRQHFAFRGFALYPAFPPALLRVLKGLDPIMLSWSPNPYALALIVSALVSGMVAFYAWSSRPRTGATATALMMLAAAEWSLGYAIAIGIHELAPRIFWAKVQHLGIPMVAPGMLIFAVQYTDREAWLTRRNLLLLMILPFLDIVLCWTNEAHGLIWQEMVLVKSGSLSLLKLKYGLFFWILAFYSYLLLVVSSLLLGHAVLFSSGLRRRQSAVLLAGALMPWIANLLYLTRVGPLTYLDLTPFGYSLTGLTLSWGLYRYRLLSAVPIAREKVVEHMRDAFIVLNEQHRFVDLNPPAQAILGVSPGQVLGKSALPFFGAWPELVQRFQTEAEGRAEIVLNHNGQPRHYAVQVSQLTNRRERIIGRLLLLQDVTDRVRASAPSRPPCTANCTWPIASRPACCPSTGRTSPAWISPGPACQPTRSAATCLITTSCRRSRACPAAMRSPSAMSRAKGCRRRCTWP
jgi:PAS domain S-box-containing protein